MLKEAIGEEAGIGDPSLDLVLGSVEDPHLLLPVVLLVPAEAVVPGRDLGVIVVNLDHLHGREVG
jgi:hypothetical protein